MKLKSNITLAALAAIVVQTALAANLPEFMPSNQIAVVLAKADAERMAAQAPEVEPTKSETPTLYTGKISDADSGGYLFRYRSYDSELSRWTTVDPSGFPDGANNGKYAPTPTHDLDPNGAYSLGGVLTPSPDTVWNADQTLRAVAFNATKVDWSASGAFSSITSQFPNYQITFPDSELAGHIEIKAYAAESARTRIQMLYTGSIPAGQQLVWIQAAYKTTPLHSWSYVPDNGGASYPWISNTTVLNDNPGLPWMSGSVFTAFSFIALKSGSNIAVYNNAVTWGFQILE